MIWLYIIGGFCVVCWLGWWVACLEKKLRHLSALFTNIFLHVVLQIFLRESCIIFFKMPLGESRWSKKRKFYGSILNRGTINVCDSGNSKENSFNVNIDENEVSNVVRMYV
jgi:hypothetical protein